MNPVASTLTINEVMTIVTASGCPASYIASQTVWVGSTTYIAIPNTVIVADESEGVPFLVIFNYPGLTLSAVLTSSALAEVVVSFAFLELMLERLLEPWRVFLDACIVSSLFLMLTEASLCQQPRRLAH